MKVFLQTISFERAGLVFCFNFHPSKSHIDYKVGLNQAGEYRIVLDSDWPEFGGHNRRERGITCHTYKEGHVGMRCHMKTYLPCRTAVVFEKVGTSANMEDLVAEKQEPVNNESQEARTFVPSSKPAPGTTQTCQRLRTMSEMNEEIPAHFL